MLNKLKEKILSLNSKVKECDKANADERKALDLAIEASQESVKALNILSKIKEDVKNESKVLEQITNKHSDLTGRLDGADEALDKAVKGKDEADNILKIAKKETAELVEKKKELEDSISKLNEDIVILERKHKTAISNRDTSAKEVVELKLIKDGVKKAIGFLADKAGKLGVKDAKKVLELQCEEDEEVRVQTRTSDPKNKIYFIAKKSNGASNPSLGIID